MSQLLTHQLAIPTTKWKSFQQSLLDAQSDYLRLPSKNLTALVTVASGGRYYATGTVPGGHGLLEGMTVAIEDVVPLGYIKVAVPVINDPATFTYLVDSALAPGSSFGTVTPLGEAQIALVQNLSDTWPIKIYLDYASNLYTTLGPLGTYQVDVPARQKFNLSDVWWSPMGGDVTIKVDYV